MIKANLTTFPTLVESPFIIATIGGYTFGSTPSGQFLNSGATLNVTFPNYMKSVNIVKVNGTVNTYTLAFSYQVAYGDDPNKLDKVFSRAAKDRKIKLSYGDWNAPSFIYKEETGLITNVTSSLNMASATIDYTVNFTSDAIGLTSTTHTFPGRVAKPSDVLKELTTNVRYGLQQVFTGMRNMSAIISNNVISSNDKKVNLVTQKNVTLLEYMNYLVNSMVDVSNTDDSKLASSKYFLTIHDDVTNQFGGTYYSVDEISNTNNNSQSIDTYVIDVNYPKDNFVMSFSLSNDQSWSILYDYANEVKDQTYSYKIDNDGSIVVSNAPKLFRSGVTGKPSTAESSWWSLMTGFPIKATLTLKGVTRPSILMSYVKLNVWFHGGQKHVSSGLYIITRQEDKIDSSGCRTTLSLLRIGEDY